LLSGAFAAPAGAKEELDPAWGLWQSFQSPVPGDPSSIGSYSAGCLMGARALPLNGKGYAVMRPSRARYYGHTKLLEFIESLAGKMQSSRLPLLLVGDLGRPRGGPMLSGHASHQSGLDVDLWFTMLKKRPKKKERETRGADSYVTRDLKMKRTWNNQHRRLVALAAEAAEVDRIFVHAAIKRDLCQHFPKADWLYKLRPWWGHDDHLHVRLKCPEGNVNCQSQEALDPAQDQCEGEELAWWFSEEAAAEWTAMLAKRSARVFPTLPEACQSLTEENRTAAK
jgi:penicillin-insensitive murein endopeptidase